MMKNLRRHAKAWFFPDRLLQRLVEKAAPRRRLQSGAGNAMACVGIRHQLRDASAKDPRVTKYLDAKALEYTLQPAGLLQLRRTRSSRSFAFSLVNHSVRQMR